MELDEFLEKDIIHFLEERKEKNIRGPVADREEDYGLYLTKDYLKEVTRALEKDELTLAQKLFNELRMHYDTLPKASLEAKKIYSILEQLYSKINAYNQLKGNIQSIKTFDDVLGEGFQGSIPQQIHQTMTKIDKKIENIDEKITTFGEEVKELKHTIMDSNIPADLITKGQEIYLKNSKINNFSHPSPQSPQMKKEEEKKCIHLYKIPKGGKKKRHGSKNTEDILDVKVKKEQHTMKTKNEHHEPAKLPLPEITDTHSIFKITPKKSQEKHDEDLPVGNIILPRIKLRHLHKKEQDVPDKKHAQVECTTNEYEKLYFDALREFSLRNYDGASKLFMKVLEIKPTHKASIIRLKQCKEAMHNA